MGNGRVFGTNTFLQYMIKKKTIGKRYLEIDVFVVGEVVRDTMLYLDNNKKCLYNVG